MKLNSTFKDVASFAWKGAACCSQTQQTRLPARSLQGCILQQELVSMLPKCSFHSQSPWEQQMAA